MELVVISTRTDMLSGARYRYVYKMFPVGVNYLFPRCICEAPCPSATFRPSLMTEGEGELKKMVRKGKGKIVRQTTMRA
jgi:hypothetical protein